MDDDDDLRAFRGILNAVLLSFGVWIIILGVILVVIEWLTIQ